MEPVGENEATEAPALLPKDSAGSMSVSVGCKTSLVARKLPDGLRPSELPTLPKHGRLLPRRPFRRERSRSVLSVVRCVASVLWYDAGSCR